MKKLHFLVLFGISFFCIPVVFSQDVKPNPFATAENTLKVLGDSITKGSTDFVRRGAVAEFNARFFDLLANPETYNYPFDSIKTISKLKSPDGKMRIYTWILPSRSDGTYKYYGVVQRLNAKTKEVKLIGLIDVQTPVEEAEMAELKAENWFGTVYYEIIEKKVGKSTYYFLLGWHGNNRSTTMKVIDVIYFDFWDNLTFGAPLFMDESKKIKNRLIFEYSAEVVMSLKYEKKKKQIVFDHLSPSSPSLKGQYQHYGPDFTYDGLYFKKGIWNYKKNLDMRNESDNK